MRWRARSGRSLRSGVAASVAAGALAATALTGCTSARSTLGTVDSGCYVALPAASSAVHHRGHLQGIRLIGVASLKTAAPRLYRVVAATSGPPVRRVCLAAFTGRFSWGDVAKPSGRRVGALAVVVIEYPNRRLLGTVIIPHPHLRFGHTHLLAD